MDEPRRPGRYSLPRRTPEVRLDSRWAAELNEQQLAAVTAPDGPVLVLAGAGSGKTRVITYRAAFLIGERGVRPWQIMLATFTNKAARSMLQRVEDVVGGAAREITGGTFHHIANLLLRRYGKLLGYDSSFTILDDSDARQVMKLARTEAGIDKAERAFPSDRLLVDLSGSMINSNLDLETLLARRFPALLDQFAPIERVLIDYTQRKHVSNQMDFDDLLVNFHRLLAEQPAVRAELAGRYRHVLVDEYQDVNHIQASIVKALYVGESIVDSRRSEVEDRQWDTAAGVAPARPSDDSEHQLGPPISDEVSEDSSHLEEEEGRPGATPTNMGEGRGLFVVGDDAQSIYSFRGADYENIRSFPYQFDGAHVFKLEINYRSTPEILTLANAILHEGDPVFRKELRPVRPSNGSKPLLLGTRDKQEQAEFVGEQLMKLREDDGLKWRDLAVLYRAHSHAVEIELELKRRDIPYVVRGGLRFFEQAHIKDLVSYLVVLANSRDELAWQRMLGMARRVGPKTIAQVQAKLRRGPEDVSPLRRFIDNGVIADVRGQGKQSLSELQSFLRGLSALSDGGTPPSDLIRAVLEGRYQEYAEVQYENWRQRVEDIEQLMVFADRFSSLSAFLSEVGLTAGFSGADIARPDHEYDREEGAVTLSTIHQAKGLEWNAVLLIGASDDVIPHRMALSDPLGEDEERRLLYVAVTRAEELLVLSYPQESQLRDFQRVINRPSRFLSQLPRDAFDEAVLEWD